MVISTCLGLLLSVGLKIIVQSFNLYIGMKWNPFLLMAYDYLCIEDFSKFRTDGI